MQQRDDRGYFTHDRFTHLDAGDLFEIDSHMGGSYNAEYVKTTDDGTRVFALSGGEFNRKKWTYDPTVDLSRHLFITLPDGLSLYFLPDAEAAQIKQYKKLRQSDPQAASDALKEYNAYAPNGAKRAEMSQSDKHYLEMLVAEAESAGRHTAQDSARLRKLVETPRIVISVEGGIVQSVHADTPDITVGVCDYDEGDEDERDEFERKTAGMVEVY